MTSSAARLRQRANQITHRLSSFAGDAAWGAASDLLAVAAGLTSLLLLTRVLEPEQYGEFVALFSLAAIFSSITYSGPGLALIQDRFRNHATLDSLTRSYLSLVLLAGVLSSLVATGLALVLNGLSLVEIVAVVVSELFANSIVWVCGWLVQAASNYRAMIRVRIGTSLLKLATVPLLFATGNLTVLKLGLAYLVVYGAWAAFLVLWYLPRLGYSLSLGRPASHALKDSALLATPLAASQIQMGGDVVTLNAYGLNADAGVYGAAFRIMMLALLPIRVIQQAAFHRFVAEGDGQPGYQLRRVRQLSAGMFGIGLLAAGGVYVGLYLLTPLLDLLIEDGFEETKDILPWLAIFIPIHALGGTPLNGLLGLGRSRERAAIYVSSAAFSLLMYVLLIPWLEWKGAVIATLIGEVYLVTASWSAIVYYQRVADREYYGGVATPSSQLD